MRELLQIEGEEKELSDEEVFLASREKPSLFGVILDRYQEAFFRKARSIAKSDEVATDIVQEAFTKMYLKSKLFTPMGDGSFKSWAYRVLINTSLTQYQKTKRENTTSLPEEFEELIADQGGLSALTNREDSDQILSIFNRMPDHLARILSQFFIEGKTQEEIAAGENISVGAVKTRVYRAKEAFRKIYSSVV